MKRSAVPSPERVERFVAEASVESGYTVADIRNGPRKPGLSRTRWRIWKRLHDLGFAKTAIARAWPCDHSSVYHGLCQLEREGR